MEKTNKDRIENIARKVGGTVYERYSGRGMFGKECLGIVCSDTSECIEEASLEGIKGAKTDSMGKQYIVYWPHLKA